MPQPYTQQTWPLTDPAPRSALTSRRIHPLVLFALVFGAVVGGLCGVFAGDIRGEPLGDMVGALLGVVAGLAFVVIGLLLYRFVRDAWSGALVLGLFGMLAMLLVGGLFGALIGLLAGILLGAVAGAVKARGGLEIGEAPTMARDTPPPQLAAPTMIARRGARRTGTGAGSSLPPSVGAVR
jgi:hypothetical protein